MGPLAPEVDVPSASCALHPLLLARRSSSARFLVAPAPDAEALARIVTVFSRAPDHGRLVPFRLIEIDNAARERLADAVEAAHAAAEPGISPLGRELAREKATQGPMLLALVGRIDPDHIKITVSDQWLAIGAALENFLLGAQAEGFGVAIRSGHYLTQPPLRAALGLGAREQLAVLLAVGTVQEWPPEKPKPSIEKVFSRWGG